MRGVAILVALLFGSTAWSQESLHEEGPYLGVTVGVFRWDQGDSVVVPIRDTAPIVKLYGGFRFNERWAIEGSYSSVSTLKDDAGFSKITDFEIIQVRGLAHFGNLFTGVGYWDADIVRASPFLPSVRFPLDDSGFSGIVGGEWSFKNRWNLRLEYELFNAEKSAEDMSALSLGVHYKLGSR